MFPLLLSRNIAELWDLFEDPPEVKDGWVCVYSMLIIILCNPTLFQAFNKLGNQQLISLETTKIIKHA